MTTFGYALSCEEHAAPDLIRNARRAEELGFSYLSVSDHYHPWIDAQGHSPFVWSVVGAIAAATERVDVGIGVTCPIIRIHPAVVAQAAATSATLLPGRFFLGVGTGEALNEHVLGDRWPPPDIRLEMLEEAVEVMRRLWEGGTVDHHGRYYTVENARLYDVPDQPVPVIFSGFGPQSVELAGRIGDGYWGTGPQEELISAYEQAGGKGPRYGQVSLCWAEDEATARRTAHRQWPNMGIKGQLAQDLPTPTHFEQAASMVREDDVASTIPCGPDASAVIKSIRQYEEAGYTHLHLHQVGDDQEGFFRFWQEELAPELS
ncbi:MAG TPA: TIGR03557 family F420-dependent LLM class oxidoreductase [Acidimicrobiales bacterium]|nr:TIGR03557 family F420-dependent LLM class oxidoreductase [Acidimicrobiales bacterium]